MANFALRSRRWNEVAALAAASSAINRRTSSIRRVSAGESVPPDSDDTALCGHSLSSLVALATNFLNQLAAYEAMRVVECLLFICIETRSNSAIESEQTNKCAAI